MKKTFILSLVVLSMSLAEFEYTLGFYRTTGDSGWIQIHVFLVTD